MAYEHIYFTPAYQRDWLPEETEGEPEIENENGISEEEPEQKPVIASGTKSSDYENMTAAHSPESENAEEPKSVILTPLKEDGEADHESVEGKVIKLVMGFLWKHDLRFCRAVSRSWSRAVREHPNFANTLSGKIRNKWYRSMGDKPDFDLDATLKWNTFEFWHFNYYRNSTVFKNYWQNAGSQLDKLTISQCSFECDGFIFLLDHCPVLQTLNLKQCKLRDLEDYHGHDSTKGPIIGAPKPITYGLRHIHIESMFKLEQCFMDYLICRTGKLESFTITKCFFQPKRWLADKDIETGKLLAMFNEFSQNIVALFGRNLPTMTKYGFHENNFQSNLFINLTLPHPVTVPELELTLFATEGNIYEHIIRFLNNCRGLKKLSLKFMGTIDNASLRNLLLAHKITLQKLELIIHGNLIPQDSSLNIDYLQEFAQLEEIQIRDLKVLNLNDVRKVIGGKQIGDGQKPTKIRRTNLGQNQTKDFNPVMFQTLESHISPTFLTILPPNIKNLTFYKYMPLEEVNFGLDSTVESFRKLTKLEIHGPWMHSLNLMVPIIFKELKLLQNLALTACGLNDMYLTGLDVDTINEIIRCLPLIGALNSLPSVDDILQVIQTTMKDSSKEIMNSLRNRLSDLSKLKQLDLSSNPNISNASLVDAFSIPGLKTLNLNQCTRIDDSSLELMGIILPGLEELHVKHCRKMSKYGFNELMKYCHKIRKVYTTKNIREKVLPRAMNFIMNPNYNDIIVATSESEFGRST